MAEMVNTKGFPIAITTKGDPTIIWMVCGEMALDLLER